MLAGIFRKLPSSIRRFCETPDGNVAIIFGIVLIPVMAVIGIAIDHSRAASARSAMQAAADAAALMAANDASKLSKDALMEKARAYVRALLSEHGLTEIDIAVNYSSTATGSALTIGATSSIANEFMSLPFLGNQKQTQLAVSSTARWSTSRFRVALALDNTASMGWDAKMDELKKAAKQIVEDFNAMAMADEDVYISIVPFARTVRISTSFKHANWLKWSGGPNWDGWEDRKGSCSISGASKTYTRSTCEADGGAWTASNGPATWNGCVMDRDQNYDVSNATPSPTNPASMVWPGDVPQCVHADILGMTSVKANKQALLKKIEQMKPLGGTNQTIGLAWAWMTHTIGSGPYPAPQKNSNFQYKDVIILLTDGANTLNRWSVDGGDPSLVDQRQSLLCGNLAKANITVFAIQLSTGGEPESAVTRACASKPDDPVYYAHITQASQMSLQFKSIYEALTRLRVAS